MKSKTSALLCFLVCFSGLAQFSKKISNGNTGNFDALRTFQIEENLNTITEKKQRAHFLKQQRAYLRDGDTYFVPDTLARNIDPEEEIFYHLSSGDYLVNNFQDVSKDSLVTSHYVMALRKAETIKSDTLICEALKRILLLQGKNQQDFKRYFKYADQYKSQAYDSHENLYADYFILKGMVIKRYHFKDSTVNIQAYAEKSLSEIKSGQSLFLKGRILQILGVDYHLNEENLPKAKEYYKSSLICFQKIKYYYAKKHVNDMLYNLGTVAFAENKFSEALSWFYQIKLKKIEKRDYADLIKIFDFMYQTHKKSNNLDSSLYYLEKRSFYNDSLKLIERANLVSEIDTKYQTEKKDQENTRLKKEKRNIFIGGTIITLLLITVGGLIYKNSLKKQKLAQQQQQLEQQKVAALLKEQELNTIDAMIEGQEKERQRIANELHDDLGGLMANVKLHFDALREKQSDALFSKTDLLLDEAYNKVRTVAHAKNSGVIANEGLLKAINHMADKVSSANRLKIDVKHFGLNERLENSLELTIFRIVQELVTNIIKHANATEATIHLTNHNDTLNIMVEDNGQGFSLTQTAPASRGMGISSIDKRVDNLNGTIEIDSRPGKGTSIIIDIPL
ncbi:MAG: sensor histidine kinase [Leeuwenhoekiella sp.]